MKRLDFDGSSGGSKPLIFDDSINWIYGTIVGLWHVAKLQALSSRLLLYLCQIRNQDSRGFISDWCFLGDDLHSIETHRSVNRGRSPPGLQEESVIETAGERVRTITDMQCTQYNISRWKKKKVMKKMRTEAKVPKVQNKTK